jgi:hypothetical protein
MIVKARAKPVSDTPCSERVNESMFLNTISLHIRGDYVRIAAQRTSDLKIRDSRRSRYRPPAVFRRCERGSPVLSRTRRRNDVNCVTNSVCNRPLNDVALNGPGQIELRAEATHLH